MMKSVSFILSVITCVTICAKDKIKLPLMGWNSWNAYMVNISDSIIKFQADQMVKSGLRDIG